jgi:RimJ/RimL family protein N-acetyltransferase
MRIELDDIMIRNWQVADAAAIARYADNHKIWRNLRDGFPHPYTLQDAEAFIGRATQCDPPTLFAIATKEEAVGSIGLILGEDVHHRTAELGYWLAEPFWGRGIMTRAVTRFVDDAMDRFNLLRIYAEPYAINPASIRVLEKCGFVREGIMHASAFKDGKVMDQYLYAIVKPELRKT